MNAARIGRLESAALSLAGALALAIAAGGCSPLSALALAPMGLSAAEATTARSVDTDSDKKDNEEQEPVSAERCAQLEQALPYVTEVKLEANGGAALRQFTLSGEKHKLQWTILYGRETDPQGWRPEADLAGLRFTPPLETALDAEHARYLIFAPAYANSVKESEQMQSFVTVFGPGEGTFQWQGRVYDYAVTKSLPCFANPS